MRGASAGTTLYVVPYMAPPDSPREKFAAGVELTDPRTVVLHMIRMARLGVLHVNDLGDSFVRAVQFGVMGDPRDGHRDRVRGAGRRHRKDLSVSRTSAIEARWRPRMSPEFVGLLGFLWVLDAADFLCFSALRAPRETCTSVGRAIAGQTPVCPLACPTGSQRLPGQGQPKAVAKQGEAPLRREGASL